MAKSLKGLVKVGVVDCNQNRICAQHQVRGVPAIKALVPGSKHWQDYQGDRSARSIDAWATSLIPNHVTYLSSAADMEGLLGACSGKVKGKAAASWGLCIVLQSDKTAVPALWKALSSVYRGKVAFGFLPSSSSAAAAPGLPPAPSLPAVYSICNGDVAAAELYSGKTKSEPLQRHIGSYVLGKKCSSKIRVDANSDLSKLTMKQLRALLQDKGLPCSGCLEKADYIKALKAGLQQQEGAGARTEL